MRNGTLPNERAKQLKATESTWSTSVRLSAQSPVASLRPVARRWQLKVQRHVGGLNFGASVEESSASVSSFVRDFARGGS